MVVIGDHDYSELIALHREWLSGFDTYHLKKWNKELERDAESALCEAEARVLLLEEGCRVIPNDTPTPEKSADFLCMKQGVTFLVEVTCCSISKIEQRTGIRDEIADGAYWGGSLVPYISRAVREKAKKFIGSEHPGIVLFGMFHRMAGIVCLGDYEIQQLLIGVEAVVFDRSSSTPPTEAKLVLETSNTLFINVDSDGLNYKREPMSAVLICSFGGNRKVKGLIHPRAARPFNPEILGGVPFCTAVVTEEGAFYKWVNTRKN